MFAWATKKKENEVITKEIVQFNNVSFAYHNSPPILQHVSFSLNEGDVLGVPTRALKTVLARLLLGIYDPSEGFITLNDWNIAQRSVTELREQVGVEPDRVHLGHTTLRDNLTFFDESIRDHQILTLLRELGLSHWLKGLPNGLDTILNSSNIPQNKGQIQLLALARVWLKRPSLIILDQVPNWLDDHTLATVHWVRRELLKNGTGIVVGDEQIEPYVTQLLPTQSATE